MQGIKFTHFSETQLTTVCQEYTATFGAWPQFGGLCPAAQRGTATGWKYAVSVNHGVGDRRPGSPSGLLRCLQVARANDLQLVSVNCECRDDERRRQSIVGTVDTCPPSPYKHNILYIHRVMLCTLYVTCDTSFCQYLCVGVLSKPLD